MPWFSIAVSVGDGDNSCLDGIAWIFDHFGVCVVTAQDYASFAIGLLSLCVWFLPLIPQIYKNYVRGHCDDALSIYFLLLWFFGDSLNLAGSLLSGQLPTQIFVAFYYIIQDAVILSQYAYYKMKNRWRDRLIQDLGPPTAPSTMRCVLFGAVLCPASLYSFRTWHSRHRRHVSFPFTLSSIFHGTTDKVGYVMGWLSCLCYLLGRVPQLIKNLKRRSTEGVAIATFWLIIVGNLLYGLSVLLGGSSLNYYILHLPWLFGSIGCVFLDVIVLLQHYVWYNYHRNASDDAVLFIDNV
ncbi:unnamed protein product [Soboliphyme baturini]|uniref:PQ loop repeat-domain-containing protein n=1 Tax=Soboliphyme baturini TaxID=241478 RepID=A0A183IML9_9BILA|nr:unnamed protein product [Soboliphyme baturini]